MADTTVNTRSTEFDRSFDSRYFPSSSSEVDRNPTIDVYEQRGNIIAKMVLLGMNPDNLDVSVDEDSLRISGWRQEEKETKNKDYTNKVVHSESFTRAVDLPKIVDASKATAEYKDGLLQVTMPISPYMKEKAVKVNIRK